MKCTPLRGPFCTSSTPSPRLAQPVTKSLHSMPQGEANPEERGWHPQLQRPLQTQPPKGGVLCTFSLKGCTGEPTQTQKACPCPLREEDLSQPTAAEQTREEEWNGIWVSVLRHCPPPLCLGLAWLWVASAWWDWSTLRLDTHMLKVALDNRLPGREGAHPSLLCLPHFSLSSSMCAYPPGFVQPWACGPCSFQG